MISTPAWERKIGSTCVLRSARLTSKRTCPAGMSRGALGGGLAARRLRRLRLLLVVWGAASGSLELEEQPGLIASRPSARQREVRARFMTLE
ncbi:MAG TPA: hypothetical protein DEA08_09180 [Planctomycetes bacterium]|nr:hypothetical protein [Planctomycetota bacterium]